MKKSINRRGHEYHVDGLGTISIIIGIASVGFILYNVMHVVFS
ncbi:MAG: hypothetical protein NT084_02635 [Bacteroidetes bacterium]|jgi:hypothetical protein|nr:hypothetical protein [Bacteroidota bacterium]